jgi:hypothetical protein
VVAGAALFLPSILPWSKTLAPSAGSVGTGDCGAVADDELFSTREDPGPWWRMEVYEEHVLVERLTA